ncbi:MAG: hypothetical protein WCP69_10885 [Bacteroidota bacterium]
MKAIVKGSIILIILASSMFSVSAFPTNPSKGENKLSTKLISAIDYPKIAEANNLEGVVYLKYSIQTDGSIEIIEMNYSNIIFAQHVRNKINKIFLPNTSLEPNEIYYAKFDFKLK